MPTSGRPDTGKDRPCDGLIDLDHLEQMMGAISRIQSSNHPKPEDHQSRASKAPLSPPKSKESQENLQSCSQTVTRTSPLMFTARKQINQTSLHTKDDVAKGHVVSASGLTNAHKKISAVPEVSGETTRPSTIMIPIPVYRPLVVSSMKYGAIGGSHHSDDDTRSLSENRKDITQKNTLEQGVLKMSGKRAGHSHLSKEGTDVTSKTSDDPPSAKEGTREENKKTPGEGKDSDVEEDKNQEEALDDTTDDNSAVEAAASKAVSPDKKVFERAALAPLTRFFNIPNSPLPRKKRTTRKSSGSRGVVAEDEDDDDETQFFDDDEPIDDPAPTEVKRSFGDVKPKREPTRIHFIPPPPLTRESLSSPESSQSPDETRESNSLQNAPPDKSVCPNDLFVHSATTTNKGDTPITKTNSHSPSSFQPKGLEVVEKDHSPTVLTVQPQPTEIPSGTVVIVDKSKPQTLEGPEITLKRQLDEVERRLGEVKKELAEYERVTQKMEERLEHEHQRHEQFILAAKQLWPATASNQEQSLRTTASVSGGGGGEMAGSHNKKSILESGLVTLSNQSAKKDPKMIIVVNGGERIDVSGGIDQFEVIGDQRKGSVANKEKGASTNPSRKESSDPKSQQNKHQCPRIQTEQDFWTLLTKTYHRLDQYDDRVKESKGKPSQQALLKILREFHRCKLVRLQCRATEVNAPTEPLRMEQRILEQKQGYLQTKLDSIRKLNRLLEQHNQSRPEEHVKWDQLQTDSMKGSLVPAGSGVKVTDPDKIRKSIEHIMKL